jgi:geranylgeranyl diphosphate synthase type I
MPRLLDQFAARADLVRARLQAFRRATTDRDLHGWAAELVPRLTTFAAQGKLVRANLVLLGCELGGGRITAAVQDAAAALELVHSGFLIHDDIIDDDALRRGQPALHVAYADAGRRRARASRARADHIGRAIAICAADAAFFAAGELLAHTALAPASTRRILQLWAHTFRRVALGEVLDVELTLDAGAAPLRTILGFYRLKTARYTFCAPLETGLLCADAPAALIRAVNAFAEHLGLVFQIKDDELGLFGATRTIGKPLGSDITQNKKTVYHHYLFARATPAQRARLRKLFGAPRLTRADVAYVRAVLESSGARAAAAALMTRHVRAARAAIRTLPIAPAQQTRLQQLVDYCITRTV